jgi:hypothetical protein
MIYRVTGVRRDKDGNVLALCGDGWTKSKAEVAREIREKISRFYVEKPEDSPRVYVEPFELAGVDHLTTTADESAENNLDNLDPC